jgi:hypothetical protein
MFSWIEQIMSLLRKLIKGSYTFSTTENSKAITLPIVVKKSQSMVTLKIKNLSDETTSTVNASNYHFVAELSSDGATLTISRVRHTDQSLTVNYQIFWFKNATVTHGNTVLDSTDKEIILSSYTANKTFSIVTMKGDRVWTANDASYLCILHRVYNNGSNNVLNLKGRLSAGTMTAYYQIVECPDLTVDRYDVTITSQSTYDYTLSTSVTTNKTMCMLSNYYTSIMGLSKLRSGRLYNTNTFRFYSFTSVSSTHNLYIIYTNKWSIERGYETYSTQNTTVTLATAIYTSKLFLNLTHQNLCWLTVNDTNVNYGDMGVTGVLEIASYVNSIELQRGIAYISTVVYWEAIAFSTLRSLRRTHLRGIERGKARGM